MRKLFILLVAICLIMVACQKTKKNEKIVNKDSIQSAIDTPIEPLKLDLKYLPELLNKSNKKLKTAYADYITLLISPIASEEDLKKIFAKRDELLPLIDEYLNNNYDNIDWENYMNNVDTELATIGIGSIYVEGMYGGIGTSDFLKPQIAKFGSEPFKLYADFISKYTASLGGEYPYMGLSSYGDVVAVGEKLYTNFKTSEYYKKIEEHYISSLIQMLDIHKLISEDKQCMEGGLSFSFYPYAADCEALDYFIKTYPDSKYAKVFEKVNKNMSELAYSSEDNPVSTVFIVITDKAKDFDEGTKKIFDYLNRGIDVVHQIQLKQDNVDNIYLAYRFYSDEQKAKKALNTIKAIIPNAKIVKVNVFDDESAVIIE